MAPLRRYLRITKYSVLECRIYLDNPALAETWLLNPRDPVLPRVIESVRPLVLPKLHEERERSRSKGKKKSVKDVVATDEFEVSIFLTDTSTRHYLLTKLKHFRDPGKEAMQSNSTKLMGSTDDSPFDVDGEVTILREESDDSMDRQAGLSLGQDLDSIFVSDEENTAQRSKRPRSSGDSSDTFSIPLSKRAKGPQDEDEDKKKMAMETTYDGFSIYGRVLCLVVKRKDRKGKGSALPGGQAMMEDFIISTQMPAEDG